MTKLTRFSLGLPIAISFLALTGFSQKGFLIDHRCTKIKLIPKAWIQKAKASLHIAYGHTSHGSQLTTGMTGLVGFTGGGGGPQFAWNRGGTGGALDLHDRAMRGDVGYYPQWVNETKKFLNDPKNKKTNVIIWSWCGQVSYRTQKQMIDQYLTPMSQLEKAYPQVRFVYMTGHLNIGRHVNTKARNDQIRAFCKAQGKILFDFADIESWNPDGVFYPYADDACYYYDAQKKRLGNWAIEWQNSHKKGVDWYSCTSAHSQPLNANRKAFAAWWLWTRLAGWKGMGTLAPDKKSIRVGTGGKVGFQLEGGPAESLRSYLLLTSSTGTVNNFSLPGNMTVVPLHFDSISLLALSNLNTPMFRNFLGTLDQKGSGKATLSLPPLPTSAVGTTLSFSFALFSPDWDFSSHPASVQLVR
jgi:hypothetical protein